eukprot:RCo028167
MGGGLAGALAMFVQVLTLMWLRTTMNFQYRYGHTMSEALALLYADGGIPRFYQGLLPALIQGPLSRFCDTAANAGALSVLDSFPSTAALPVAAKTILASASAALSRVLLMPVDTVKTTLQVEGGRVGLRLLAQKMQKGGLLILFDGALASLAATFVGHYPWFATFNTLDSLLPSAGSSSGWKVFRSAVMGCTSTVVADCCANSLRVVKTAKQTHPVAGISYRELVMQILAQDGLSGLFLRGLKTRLVVNVLQGTLFSVLWRMMSEWFSGE